MKVVFTALAVSLSLAGCTHLGTANQYQPYPQAQLPAASNQDKIQAAQHWDVLAQNEAQMIAKGMPARSVVAISAGSNNSAFAKAYKNLLAQHLLANGLMISEAGSGEQYLVEYETQVVRHRDRDDLRPPAGSLSATGAGAWLIGHAIDSWSKPGLVAIPFLVAGDVYLANNRDAVTPNTEVLVTTRVRSGNMLVQSNTSMYYFNPGDRSLYATAATKSIAVTDQR